MRKRIFSFLSPPVGLGTVVLFLFLTVSALADARSVTIETKGGERFIGEFVDEKLKILHLGQEFELPLAEITEISEDLTLFKLEEEMRIRGKIAAENLVIRTRFGDISVPVADIKTIELEALPEDEAPAEAAPAVALPKRCPHCGRLIKAEAIPEEAVVVEDWKVKLGPEQEIVGRGGGDILEFTLQYVERKGNDLIVGIGLRNIAREALAVRLPEDFQVSTLLLDEKVGTKYKIRRIRGLSVRESLRIAPRGKKVAHFTFPFPEGVKKIRLDGVVTWANWRPRPRWYRDTLFSIDFTIPPQSGSEADE